MSPIEPFTWPHVTVLSNELVQARYSPHPKSDAAPAAGRILSDWDNAMAFAGQFGGGMLFPETLVTPLLRESLANALGAIPFYAGRLAFSKDGRLDIKCNNAGARFVAASTSAKLAEVAAALNGRPYSRSPANPWRVFWPPHDVDALVRQQWPLAGGFVLHLSGGGTALWVAAHHCVADFESLQTLAAHWAAAYNVALQATGRLGPAAGVTLSLPPTPLPSTRAAAAAETLPSATPAATEPVANPSGIATAAACRQGGDRVLPPPSGPMAAGIGTGANPVLQGCRGYAEALPEDRRYPRMCAAEVEALADPGRRPGLSRSGGGMNGAAGTAAAGTAAAGTAATGTAAAGTAAAGTAAAGTAAAGTAAADTAAADTAAAGTAAADTAAAGTAAAGTAAAAGLVLASGSDASMQLLSTEQAQRRSPLAALPEAEKQVPVAEADLPPRREVVAASWWSGLLVAMYLKYHLMWRGGGVELRSCRVPARRLAELKTQASRELQQELQREREQQQAWEREQEGTQERGQKWTPPSDGTGTCGAAGQEQQPGDQELLPAAGAGPATAAGPQQRWRAPSDPSSPEAVAAAGRPPSSLGGVEWVSTNDALVGRLLQVLHSLPLRRAHPLSCFMAADVRRRLQPALPPSQLGNLLYSARLEGLQPSQTPLGRLAGLVRRSLSCHLVPQFRGCLVRCRQALSRVGPGRLVFAFCLERDPVENIFAPEGPVNLTRWEVQYGLWQFGPSQPLAFLPLADLGPCVVLMYPAAAPVATTDAVAAPAPAEASEAATAGGAASADGAYEPGGDGKDRGGGGGIVLSVSMHRAAWAQLDAMGVDLGSAI